MVSLFLWGLWARFQGWIIAGGAALLAVAYFAQSFTRKGREQEREKNRKEVKRAIKKKRALRDDISNDSDAELDKRLRKWVIKDSE